MKILKILFIAVTIVVVVIIAGLMFFLKTFDLNRYRVRILEQASSALNRSVDIQDMRLTLSLRQGVGVTARKLSIQDDPRFQNGNFLEAERIFLGVDIRPLITERKISVSKIEILSPRVTLIRNKAGVINAQSLGQIPPGTAEEQHSPASSQSAVSPAALPALLVQNFIIDNGMVTYIDKSLDPALTIPLSRLTVGIENFSLNAPAHFSVGAAVFSDKNDIHAEGTLQPDIPKNEIITRHAVVEIDLSAIKPEQLVAALPMLKDVMGSRPMKGKAKLSIETLAAGAKGLTALSAHGEIAEGSVTLKQLAAPLESLKARMDITPSNMTIQEASCGIGKGMVNVRGEIKDYLKEQAFSFTVSAQNLTIAELIDFKKQPVKADGTMASQITVRGAGFTPDALKTLAGEGKVTVTNGRLIDFNVFQAVLEKVAIIPGLYDKIKDSIPQPYKDQLTRNDTVFNTIDLPVTIKDEHVFIETCLIDAQGFSLLGNAQADVSSLNGPGGGARYSFDGSFIIAEDLSGAMAGKAPELSCLFDEKNRITIPLKVDGQGQANPRVRPDMEYLGKKFAVSKGASELGKMLDKVLGSTPDESGASQGQAGQGEQIVNDLLKKILK